MFFNNKKKSTPKTISFTGTAVVSDTTKDPDGTSEARYLDRFLSRNRIDAPRKGIFVNRELVHRLAKYAAVMGQGEASIGAYVEEIILEHFERNAGTIKSLFNASPVRDL